MIKKAHEINKKLMTAVLVSQITNSESRDVTKIEEYMPNAVAVSEEYTLIASAIALLAIAILVFTIVIAVAMCWHLRLEKMKLESLEEDRRGRFRFRFADEPELHAEEP